jgi:hypothetical protein
MTEIKDVSKKIIKLQKQETKIINIKIYTNNNKVFNSKYNLNTCKIVKNASEKFKNIIEKPEKIKEDYLRSFSEKVIEKVNVPPSASQNFAVNKFTCTNLNTETSKKNTSQLVVPTVITHLYEDTNNNNDSDSVCSSKKKNVLLINLSEARKQKKHETKHSNSSSINNLFTEEKKYMITELEEKTNSAKKRFSYQNIDLGIARYHQLEKESQMKSSKSSGNLLPCSLRKGFFGGIQVPLIDHDKLSNDNVSISNLSENLTDFFSKQRKDNRSERDPSTFLLKHNLDSKMNTQFSKQIILSRYMKDHNEIEVSEFNQELTAKSRVIPSNVTNESKIEACQVKNNGISYLNEKRMLKKFGTSKEKEVHLVN